jgi:hypothetical protein
MRIDVRSIKQLESLVLCKLSKVVIGELPTTNVVSIERLLDETDRMVLKVEKYYVNQDGKQRIKNPLYDEIKPKRYLLLNDEEYFIIESIKESKLTGTKEVTAVSGEQVITNRVIMMDDFGVQIFEDDIENNVYSLKSLLKELNWELSEADDSLVYNEDGSPKLRWQESVSSTWADFMVQLAGQFNFIPIYDTLNRKVSLLDIDKMGEEIKICLCKDNYMRSKEKTKNAEDLITLLKLKGSDELDIASHILGGYDFLMDFSYFKEINEMTDELISHLDKYDEMIKIRTPQWQSLVAEKLEKETQLGLLRTRWQMSISTIDCYKGLINRYVLKDMVVEENETRVKLSEELDKELLMRLEIEELIEEITLLDESITNINLLCRFETCTDENGNLVFNENTLNELLEFIFVDIYQDDSFVNADDLIEKGKSILTERCRPTVQVEVSSINFLGRIVDNNFRLKWNGTLSFGDLIILIDEDTGEEELYYFLGYTIDYHSNHLDLRISNKKTLRDYTKTINQYLKDVKNHNTIITNNNNVLNQVKQNRLNMGDKEAR